MTILEQYRQFRQSGGFYLLYQLADRLDLLTSFERRGGAEAIPYSRYGAIVRRIEKRLDDPEQLLANAIYRQFSEAGIQSAFYKVGLTDDTLTIYCQVRSKLYWTGKLTQEEWSLTNEIEDTEVSLNPEFERSISEALENCFAQFGTWEAA